MDENTARRLAERTRKSGERMTDEQSGRIRRASEQSVERAAREWHQRSMSPGSLPDNLVSTGEDE